MNTLDRATRLSARSPMLWAIAWGVTYGVSRGLLNATTLEPWARVLVALMPVPFVVMTLAYLARDVRGLDELQRRIHLEALAMAFPLTVALLMTLGMLQRAITLPFENFSYLHVSLMLPVLYCLGLYFAKRRYA